MNNTKFNSRPTAKKPPKGFNSHANFIEALKSSGGNIIKDTAKSFKDDLIKGTASQMVDTIFNTNQKSDQQENQPQPFNFSEYLKSGENRGRQKERIKYELEQTETVIFNRRKQEVDQKIETIRIELKSLATEIVHLDKSIETAISQEITDPGTYHLNFFEKLISFLKNTRKRVVESRNWAALHNQRSTTKSYYWKMANKKKGGTKFSLSQERQVATQTG